MSRPRVTIEMVRMARNQLEKQGEYPSEDKIRELIGFGSSTTIHRLITEIRTAEREEKLLKEIEIPLEIRAAFSDTVAKRVTEHTEIISKDLAEVERCQKETLDQLTAATTRIESLQAERAKLEEEKAAIAEELTRQKSAHELAEAKLMTSIQEKDASLEAVARKRDALHDQIRNLSGEGEKFKELAQQRQEERDSYKEKVHQLESELNAEKTRAAVSERECSLLRENLLERDDRLRNQQSELTELRAINQALHEKQNGAARGARSPRDNQNKGKASSQAK